jgi:protein-disulfide isomerase
MIRGVFCAKMNFKIHLRKGSQVKALSQLFALVLFISLHCAAQSGSPIPNTKDLNTKIDRQVRATYKIPEEVPIAVGPFTPSKDWPSYDAFQLTIGEGSSKQQFEFLMSKDRNSMLKLTRFDLAGDPYAEVMKKIDLRGRPIRGAKSQKVVVVVFDDLQCPFCTIMHQTLFPQVLKEYGDRVTFVYKDFPLPNHAWATHAAVDANCLGAQNQDAYWSFVDSVHASQKEINNEQTLQLRFEVLDQIALQLGAKNQLDAASLQSCVKAQNDVAIKASISQGDLIGVDATPTVLINGKEISSGAAPLPRLRAALDRALQDAGSAASQPAVSQASPKE